MARVGTWQWKSLLIMGWVCEGGFTIVGQAIKVCIHCLNLINTLLFHQASVGRLCSFFFCGPVHHVAGLPVPVGGVLAALVLGLTALYWSYTSLGCVQVNA